MSRTVPLRVMVVDDEPGAGEVISALLGAVEVATEHVATATSIVSALKLLPSARPDLVFLDVEMPGGSGFEFLDAVPDRSFEVIYTTAHAEHALRAIRTRPLDYLLKPIHPDLLAEAMSRVLVQRKARADRSALLVERLELASVSVKHYVRFGEITRAEGEGSYCTVHLADGERITVSRNLGWLEERLPEELFFRCHQSHIVRLDLVRAYDHADGGVLMLTNGARVPLATRKHADFERVMKGAG